jgi:uncharacterized protein (TIGR03435 family)
MIRRCVLLPLWAAVAFAQAPTFDVASVKAVPKTDGSGYRYQLTPTSLTMRQVSLGYAIRMAYRLRNAWDLVGPNWLDPPTLNTYDFEGRMSQPTSEERMWECLRTLLVERFGLEARRESRPLPVFLLLRGSGEPKLAQSQKSETKVRYGEHYEQIFEHVSMAQLAQQLGPPTCNRPVLDRTGIEGFFDFTLDRSRYVLDADTGKPILDWRGAIDTEGSTLRAIRDQLGLEVKADRAPFEVLVVDRVQRVPSAN